MCVSNPGVELHTCIQLYQATLAVGLEDEGIVSQYTPAHSLSLCIATALHEEKDGKENVVEFDFLGKDSIRYYNLVPVEKQVFKNLRLFMENKEPGDDLFDRLTVSYHGDVC